jgi:predicted regulator of Ras-like GTPase activity (Roadblock/LC7/MglB family)
VLNELARGFEQIEHAVLVGPDGLPAACSGPPRHERTAQLSSFAWAWGRLTEAAATEFQAGPSRQSLVELDHAFMIVTSLLGGWTMAVLATPEVDLGALARAAGEVARRLEASMVTRPR